MLFIVAGSTGSPSRRCSSVSASAKWRATSRPSVMSCTGGKLTSGCLCRDMGNSHSQEQD